MLNEILRWLSDYGLIVAFANVLLVQLGVPLPAYPVLVFTGAMSVTGRYSAAGLVAVAVAGCLLADLCWYGAGRRYGHRVLKTLCRITVSPDSCVRATEQVFERFGVWSLLVAKMVPGFGTIACTLSGRLRVNLLVFLLFDAMGSAIYAGIAIGLGIVFHDAVGDVVDVLNRLGRIGLLVVLGGFVAFFAVKWLQRLRLIRELRMVRISVSELQNRISAGTAPTILDVRSTRNRALDGSIPGALPWPTEWDAKTLPDLERGNEVVLYCDCPNEAYAATVSKRLKQAGFAHVRPLHGGMDAWIAADLPVDRSAGAAPVAERPVSTESLAGTAAR